MDESRGAYALTPRGILVASALCGVYEDGLPIARSLGLLAGVSPISQI